MLIALDFIRKRRKGSHVYYRHTDGRTTTAPHHPGRLLARPLIRKIMKDIQLSTDEYDKLINLPYIPHLTLSEFE
ncbi:MAG: type II toxin-antitoxin system HicA family toxin [Spirochaetales bacterium]|nr:type II toxin-antitoxin system HicA family toxin [Spirochaetales bacterium]